MRSVVLVEPEQPDNTGFIARLCENFNFEMKLVDPKFNLKECRKTANNAQEKLRNAKIYDEVDKAVKETEFIVGTKPKRGTEIKQFNFTTNTSVMLGRESSGLTEEELALCDAVIQIDANYNSLNLSHAAAITMNQAHNSKDQEVDRQRIKAVEEKTGKKVAELLKTSNPSADELDQALGEL